MKTAILWGTVFGILQAIISLVVGLYFSSSDVSAGLAALSCLGLLLSFVLTVACSLIGTLRGKTFGIGFWAGIISTALDVLASLLVYILNPALLEVGLIVSVISFATSIGFGIVLSAVGAGIGLLINRQQMNPSPGNA